MEIECRFRSFSKKTQNASLRGSVTMLWQMENNLSNTLILRILHQAKTEIQERKKRYQFLGAMDED